MSGFKNLAEDKLIVLDKIFSSQEILKALTYNEMNFLDQPDVSPEDVLFDRVFPHRFIPKTSEKKKTYIAISFERYLPIKNAFRSGLIKFNVFTHQDLFRTDYGYLRTDYIIMKLDELFNGERGLGIGKVEFSEMDALSVNTDYHGSYITFKVRDFQ
jgi:hypothetical protein